MIYPRVILVSEIKRIMKRYIEKDALMSLNISANNKDELYSKLDNTNMKDCDNFLFNSIKKEIYEITIHDILNKYHASIREEYGLL